MGILARIFHPKLAIRQPSCCGWHDNKNLEFEQEDPILRYPSRPRVRLRRLRNPALLRDIQNTQ